MGEMATLPPLVEDQNGCVLKSRSWRSTLKTESAEEVAAVIQPSPLQQNSSFPPPGPQKG